MRPARLPRALVGPLLIAATVATALVPVLIAAAPVASASTTPVPPSAANTGVPDGATLRRVDGTLILNRAGATYTNLDIHGRVIVDAPNITLANSIVRGDSNHVLGSLIDCNRPRTDHHGFVVRDSTLIPTYPSAYYQAGILGHDFTVLRTEISKTVDGVHVYGGNVTVQRSFIHDTTHFEPAQNPFNKSTHNDGVQIVMGANVLITGNTIYGNHNSGMQITQDDGVVSNVQFVGNWASGGGCTVNVSPYPRTWIGGVTVKNNLFKHDTSVPNCAIVLNRGVSMTATNNFWRDTGKAVALSRGQ